MSLIRIKPRAKADLAEIWRYIAIDSDAVADTFIATLHAKFQVIANSPNIGRARDALAVGVRSFPVGRYVVFYRVLSDAVVIIRVLHSARDILTVYNADA